MKIFSNFLIGSILWFQILQHSSTSAQDETDARTTDPSTFGKIRNQNIPIRKKPENFDIPDIDRIPDTKEAIGKKNPTNTNEDFEPDYHEEIEDETSPTEEVPENLKANKGNSLRSSNRGLSAKQPMKGAPMKYKHSDYDSLYASKGYFGSEGASNHPSSEDGVSKFSDAYESEGLPNPYAYYSHAPPSSSYNPYLHMQGLYDPGYAMSPKPHGMVQHGGGRHILPINKYPRNGEERYEEILYKEIYKYPEGSRPIKPIHYRGSLSDGHEAGEASCGHDHSHGQGKYGFNKNQHYGYARNKEDGEYYTDDMQDRYYKLLQQKKEEEIMGHGAHKIYRGSVFDDKANEEVDTSKNFRSEKQSADAVLSENIQRMIELNKEIIASLAAAKIDESSQNRNDNTELDLDSKPSNKIEFVSHPDLRNGDSINLMRSENSEVDKFNLNTDLNLEDYEASSINSNKHLRAKELEEESSMSQLNSDSESEIDESILSNVQRMNALNKQIMTALSAEKFRANSMASQKFYDNLRKSQASKTPSLYKEDSNAKESKGGPFLPEIVKKPYFGLLKEYPKEEDDGYYKSEYYDDHDAYHKHALHCLDPYYHEMKKLQKKYPIHSKDHYLSLKPQYSESYAPEYYNEDSAEYYKPQKKYELPLLQKLLHHGKNDYSGHINKGYYGPSDGVKEKLLHKLLGYDKGYAKDKVYSKDKDLLLHKLYGHDKNEYVPSKPKPEDYGYTKENDEYSYIKSILANQKGKPVFTDQLEPSPNFVYGPGGNNIPFNKYSSDYGVPTSNIETSRGLSYPTSHGMALYPEFGKPLFNSGKHEMASHPSMSYTSVY